MFCVRITRTKILVILLICSLVAVACGGDWSFDPYDYKKSEDAELKEDSGYAVKVEGKGLKLEKKVPLPIR